MNTRILRATLFTPGLYGRWGIPLNLEGKPGTAKTATWQALSHESGLHLETVIASIREPSDFLGLPIPIRDNAERLQVINWMRSKMPNVKVVDVKPNEIAFAITDYAPPAWAIRATIARHALVFFDEFNTAPPAVQAALLRVILEGMVGERELPKTVRFAMAMNSTEDAAGGWDIAPPLANRVGHAVWESPDPEVWCDWRIGGGGTNGKFGDAAAEEARVMEAWDIPFAQACGLVAAFIRTRPELLMKMPSEGDPQASKAWPSPRTWDFLTCALAGSMVHNLAEEDRDEWISCYVGTEPAGELITFLANADLPNPADLLDGKVKWTHDPNRLDRTAAVLSACAAYVTSKSTEKREKRAAALWKLMAPIVEDAADVTVPAGRTLCRARLALGKEAKPVLVKLQPVLKAAGIQP
ncbi:hypothetical protein LCGC14_0750180 [marine sediment metagenome]|uniref:ATPase dynein-related AAA domain-containing protein n=1 Tax=marine sediment metagenome TaxID=412755 RepID=A0A0F9Q467_9ZZZZ